MSEFDKEAERKKLRKQFEHDERKRENTQRMSELLLQGATMTDTHCDNCGDPLFRYDGQEFCPSCQTNQQQPAETEQSTESTQIEIETETETTTPDESPQPTAANPSAPLTDDLAAAHQSLTTTITRFAKRAEATDDPERARTFLAATEDAAAALEAVQRATQ